MKPQKERKLIPQTRLHKFLLVPMQIFLKESPRNIPQIIFCATIFLFLDYITKTNHLPDKIRVGLLELGNGTEFSRDLTVQKSNHFNKL